MRKIEISVRNVSVRFRVLEERTDGLKEFIMKFLKGDIRHIEFTALESINFDVYKGERIGIIGNNGAGKTTLLKVIAGVLKPSEGKVMVNGRIAPLLGLGAGFDNELSGAENIYLNGAILGKSKEYMDKKFNTIVEFSELKDFINLPIKNYSDGMRARLGFAVATEIAPDILILDEVLGVGDQQFKKKSSEKMAQMISEGRTVIIVSHSLTEIERLTDRVIWIEKGKIIEIGDSKIICSHYKDFVNKQRI